MIINFKSHANVKEQEYIVLKRSINNSSHEVAKVLEFPL